MINFSVRHEFAAVRRPIFSVRRQGIVLADCNGELNLTLYLWKIIPSSPIRRSSPPVGGLNGELARRSPL